MSNAQNFVESCLSGEALPEDADEFVDAWHDSSSKLALHEFLGFTKDEYALWVEQPKSLRYVLFARKRALPLPEVLHAELTMGAAARAGSVHEAREVLAWLRHTKRVP